VQLGKVTTEAVQQWVSGMSGAPGTVRKNAGVLSSILDHAVSMRRLAANPCKGVILPRQVKKQRRYLTDVEVKALADAAGVHGFEVLVLAYCGLRFGEFAALKVGDVDLGRRRLMVQASVTEVSGAMEWSDAKTHRRRNVPFPSFLDEGMAARVEGRGRDEILFAGRGGNPIREGNARRDWFNRAVEKSGIGYLTPHELRHTAASLAVRSGASVLAVQRMLGHKSAAMTLDTYADLFDDDLDAVMDRVAAARAEAIAGSGEAVLRPVPSGGH
jgi:integrase